MDKSSRLRAALLALAGATLVFGARSASASGGVQIDTSAFNYQPVSFCTLGQACGTSYNLNFALPLGNGTTYDRIYVYKEGAVGLGAPLPLTANVDNIHSLGGAYAAPALTNFDGYDVHAEFALSGGTDHGLAAGVNDAALLNFFVNVHTTGDPADLPQDERGEFQILFHTTKYGVGPAFNGFVFNYGGPAQFGPNPGTASNLLWPGTGVPAGVSGGSNTTGIAVPEPAAWALMIGGFAMAGAALRRRAAAAA